MTTPYQKIDEEFDKEFGEDYITGILHNVKIHVNYSEFTTKASSEDIKSFLHTALSSQAQEIMERTAKNFVSSGLCKKKDKIADKFYLDLVSLLSEYIANK